MAMLSIGAGSIGGCAYFTPDAGMSSVQAIAAGELGKDVVRVQSEAEAEAIGARVHQLLKGTLTADRAVQIALLNNRGLQAAFAELAAVEADAIDSSLPPSPSFALSRLAGPAFPAGATLEIERQIVVNLLGWITLRDRQGIADARFRQAQMIAGEAVFRLAAETRRAYYRAVAAAQLVRFLEDTKLIAEAGSDIAQQLGQTGGLSKGDQAREHAFNAEVGAQLGLARLRAAGERERLTRLLGVWGNDTGYTLPAKLADLPGRIRALRDIEREAIERRIDLQIARADLEILARILGLTRRTRFVNALDVRGISRFERTRTVSAGQVEIEKLHKNGADLEFQIPIFDFGEARVRRAEEIYMQAVHRLAERAVNVRSEVRQAYLGYRAIFDVAHQYRREVLPLRDIILQQTQLNVNAMQQDLSRLLVDARARIASNIAAIEAQRDFWIARTDLQVAIIGGGGLGAIAGQQVRAAGAAEAGGGH